MTRAIRLSALAAAAARSGRYDEDCAVVLVDLDHFKAYTDVLGHVAGDAALRAVASPSPACRSGASTLAGRLSASRLPAQVASWPLTLRSPV